MSLGSILLTSTVNHTRWQGSLYKIAQLKYLFLQVQVCRSRPELGFLGGAGAVFLAPAFTPTLPLNMYVIFSGT